MAGSNAAQATEASDVETHLKHEPPKRKKTWGEHVFDWRTYGGIALLGNEAASLVITEATKEGGRFHTMYSNFENWFAKYGKEGSKLSKYIVGREAAIPKIEPRLPKLLVATIGGMLMVPFVKYAEDHKGEQVRKLDRKHYGAMTDSDPKLIEAHEEMDEAPKQSWGSLMKGRVTTVLAAIAADYAFGWDHALTTKIHKKASLDGLADMVASNFQDKHKGIAKNATWLLLLSSTLTVLFYASSKLFAKKQEEKVERKQEQLIARVHGTHADGVEDALESASAEQAEAKPVNETPTLQVKNIRREETVTSVPQLSQGA